jgi:hypothetical protein
LAVLFRACDRDPDEQRGDEEQRADDLHHDEHGPAQQRAAQNDRREDRNE